MEIKTAEQYVVAELIEQKEIIADLKDDLTIINDSYDRLLSEYDDLRCLVAKHLRLRSDGENVICFDGYVWEKYDKKDFDKLVSFFPEILVETEEEENE